MGIREGLLALLAEEPKYGYQLKVEFEHATGDAWSLNVGQVYTTLQRLERDALVEAHETDDEGRISYRITAAGREELIEWMARPVRRTAANRDEVSMKLLLAMVADVIDPLHVLAIQRDATMTTLQDFTRLKAETAEDDLAWLLHLDRLILRAEADLRWLERVEERLSARIAVAADVPAAQEEPRQLAPGGKRS